MASLSIVLSLFIHKISSKRDCASKLNLSLKLMLLTFIT